MLSLSEARDRILSATPILPADCLPLRSALHRWLREPILSPEDFPAFHRSAMDGYLVRADDPSLEFRVIGEIQAGADFTPPPATGECLRIFTGAPVPDANLRVIIQENVRRTDDRIISLTPFIHDGPDHVRRRGEDRKKGDVLLPAETYVGPGEIAALAQAGITNLSVSPKPRVLHITTGDELVPYDVIPRPNQIRNSNALLIEALLHDSGAELVFQRHSPDDADLLQQAITSAGDDSWDLLLISGGASVGDYDFGTRVLRSLDFEIIFAGLRLKPGKPLVFARRDRQIAFVIPGNPLSHFVTFHVAIKVALERLQNAPPRWPLVLATLRRDLPAAQDPRETYLPAHLHFATELFADPLPHRSSGDLKGLIGVQGLVQRLAPAEPAPAGARLPCLLLADHLT